MKLPNFDSLEFKLSIKIGAAMAAGAAEGIGVWDIHSEDSSNIICDVFKPKIAQHGN